MVYYKLTIQLVPQTKMLTRGRPMSKGKTELSYSEATKTLVGTKKKELIDTETGEKILVDQITKRVYGTKNFWKVYLMDFLMVLGIFDSKQVDVFIYIVENTSPSNNTFIGTYDKISHDVNVCRQTIAKIMKKLQDKGFIKKVQNGVWLVNPNILMKGNDTKRQILLNYYDSEEPINELTYSRTKKAPISIEDDPNQMSIQKDFPELLPKEEE